MSLVRICDRKCCGAIIETKPTIMELQAPGVERFDLCPQCLEELRKWLNSKDNPTKGKKTSQSPCGDSSLRREQAPRPTKGEPLKERMILHEH